MVLDGLATLEYRGYDSAGAAFLTDKICLFKTSGRVSDLAKITPDVHSHTGIGHTRWATHGKPSQANAHPHLSFDKRFAVAHNGVITNFAELKDSLTSMGIPFVSDTDSEIIAHLLSVTYDGDMVSTMQKVADKLNGAATFLALKTGDDCVYMHRRGASLAVGKGKGECIVASDALAITPYTNLVAVLCDGETAVMSKDGVRFFKQGKQIDKPFRQTDRSAPKYCSCYMRAEIDEISTALKNAYSEISHSITPSVTDMIRNAKRMIFFGCGTAYHASRYGKVVFEKAGIMSSAVVASEIDDERFVDENCLCVFTTQSGETADTLFALAKCKAMGAKTLAITNVKESSVTFMADESVFIGAGAEVAVAATKSYVCQLLALYMLSKEKTGERIQKAVIDELSRAAETCTAKDLYEPFVKNKNIFFIGKGIDNVTAQEGALKFKEITCKFADAYGAGELKHGSIALVDDKSVAYVIATNTRDQDRVNAAIKELQSRGAYVYAIGVSDNLCADKTYVLPNVYDENLYPILSVIPLQNLALTASLCLGLNPDKPRNLAKSVTVI